MTAEAVPCAVIVEPFKGTTTAFVAVREATSKFFALSPVVVKPVARTTMPTRRPSVNHEPVARIRV